MIWAHLAQFDHVAARNLARLVDGAQRHLFLLNGIEPRLPHIGRWLPDVTIHGGAHGIRASFLDAVRLNKPNLHQSFQGLTRSRLIALDRVGEAQSRGGSQTAPRAVGERPQWAPVTPATA